MTPNLPAASPGRDTRRHPGRKVVRAKALEQEGIPGAEPRSYGKLDRGLPTPAFLRGYPECLPRPGLQALRQEPQPAQGKACGD